MGWDKQSQAKLQSLQEQVDVLMGAKKQAISEVSNKLHDELTKSSCIYSKDAYDIIDALADQWDAIVPLMEEYRRVRK